MAYYTGKRRSSRMIYLEDPTFLFSTWSDDVYTYCKNHGITQDVFALMCGSKSHGVPNSAKQNGSLNKEVFRKSCKIIKKDWHCYFRTAPATIPDASINPIPAKTGDTATAEALVQVVSQMKEQTQVLKDIAEILQTIASAWS